MSLFKARDWWSTTVGEDEEFDQGCLCVANFDNADDELDKIIIGSYHGILRIFNPRPTKTDDGWSGYRPEDVMLENSLQHPILQIEAGKFASSTESVHIAILHPRKLAVYNVSASVGSVEHGRHYQLKMAYEHNLQRTAFNFCYGPFGAVKGRDFICVQSMDGTLSFFEQESFSFSRFLPGALLPGPIKYIPKLDSFVTVSSSWQVECYKYQVLATAVDAKTKEESQNIKSGKRVTFDWSCNIGEPAIDMAVINYPNVQPSILILGERNIFSVAENGKLKYLKKLEFDPSCFMPYGSLQEGTVNYLVGTHTQTLMVFQDVMLKWSAKLDHVPVQICIGSFSGLKGVIVSLSDKGRLDCSYLGTDPALYIPPTIEARELNYDDLDKEMATLQQRIKKTAHKSVLMPNLKQQEDDLSLIVSPNPGFDETSTASGVEFQDSDPIPSISVRIQLKSRMTLENVKLLIHTSWPLATNQTSVEIPSVDPNKPAEKFVSFFIKGKALPPDLAATVSANYTSASGAPRVATAIVKLPLKLIVKPVLPVKTAEYKLTLDTNKPPANLNEIFPELLGENASGPGAALGFQYYGGQIVTVLASKTSQRYRLQCDRFEAMWLIAKELSSRLNNHYNKGKPGSFAVYYSGTVPLQEYFDLIDCHFEFRLNAERCKEMLSQRSAQFRSIQRRLLTRFKDKTPAPLQNLDTLLEGTYRQILHLADAIEDNKMSQEIAACSLSSATHLFNFLIKVWTNMSDDEYKVLLSTITPIVTDSLDNGWVESVDAAVTHVLRTTLAKAAKDQTLNPQPLQMPDDTTKVKKHIALMIDKLGKGARLIEGLPTNSAVNIAPSPRKDKKAKVSATSKTVMENGHIDNSDNPETLIGSQYGMAKHKRKEPEMLSMNGAFDDMPILGLPAQNKPEDDEISERRKKKQIESMVPDLDDMESGDVVMDN